MEQSGIWPPSKDAMEFCMSEDTLRRGYMVSQKELHVSERAELRNTLLDQTWLPEEQNQILQTQLQALVAIYESQKRENQGADTNWRDPQSCQKLRQIPEPPRSTKTQDEWIQEVAKRIPLWHLERILPHVWNTKSLLASLYRFKVPVLRATWLIKFILNVQLGTSWPSISVKDLGHKCTQQWTEICTDYMDSRLSELNNLKLVDREQDGRRSDAFQLIRKAFLNTKSHMAQEWLYVLALIGQTFRDGMLSASSILAWLIPKLKQKFEPYKLALVLVLPIVLKDISLSQTDVRKFCHYYRDQIRFTVEPADTKHSLFRQALSSVLNSLVIDAPQFFISLGSTSSSQDFPGALQRLLGIPMPIETCLPEEEDHRLTTTCLDLIKERSRLFASVRSHALGCDEASVVEILEAVFRGEDFDAVIQRCIEKVQPWTHSHSIKALAFLICDWASRSPSECVRDSESSLYLWHSFEVLLNKKKQLKFMAGSRLLKALIQNTLIWENQQCENLQESITEWLESCSLPAALGELQGRDPMGFLQQVIIEGVFCPGVYLQKLIAHGVFHRGAHDLLETSQSKGASELHLAVLSQIDVEAPMPSLQQSFNPGTPSQTELGSHGKRSRREGESWTIDLQLFLASRERILQEVSPPMDHDVDRKSEEEVSEMNYPSKRAKTASEESSLVEDVNDPHKLTSNFSFSSNPPEHLKRWYSGRSLGSKLFRSFSTRSERSVGGELAMQGEVEELQRLISAILFKGVRDDLGHIIEPILELRVSEKLQLRSWLFKQITENSIDILKSASVESCFLLWLCDLLNAANGTQKEIQCILHLLKTISKSQVGSTGFPGGEYSDLAVLLCSMLKIRREEICMTKMQSRVLDTLANCITSHVKAGRKLDNLPHLSMIVDLSHGLKGTEEIDSWILRLQADTEKRQLSDAVSTRLKHLRAQEASGKPPKGINDELKKGSDASEGLSTGSASRIDVHQENFLDSWKQLVSQESLPKELCIAAQNLLADFFKRTHDANNDGIQKIIMAILHLKSCLPWDFQEQLDKIILDAFSAQPKKVIQTEFLQTFAALGLLSTEQAVKHHPQIVSTSSEATGIRSSMKNEQNMNSLAVILGLDFRLTCLPFSLLWQAIEPLIAKSSSGGANNLIEVLRNPGIRTSLLSKPADLLSLLRKQSSSGSSLSGSSTSLMHWEIMQMIVSGSENQSQLDLIGTQYEMLDFEVAKYLDILSVTTLSTVSAILRAILDQQILCGGLKRGLSHSDAFQKAMNAAEMANTSASSLTEEEKTFTSKILAQLLGRPDQACLLAKLAQTLGKALQEYLLQQIDWVLQDVDTILGHQALTLVLERRFGTLLSTPNQDVKDNYGQPHDCSVECAFANIALACLGSSQPSQQRAFADQLLTQLQKLGDILKEYPLLSKRRASDENTPSSPPMSQALSSQTELEEKKADMSPSFFGSAKARRVSLQQKASLGTQEGVRKAIQLRLKIIPSFLPLIYSDREVNQRNNLRHKTVIAFLGLLSAEYVYASQESGEKKADRMLKTHEAASHALFGNLLQILQALVSGEWASWIRGGKENLRDVPAYDTTVIHQELVDSLLPCHVKGQIFSALNHFPPANIAAMIRNQAVEKCSSSDTNFGWVMPDWHCQMQSIGGVACLGYKKGDLI